MINIPDVQIGTRHRRKLDGTRETLVTLDIVVLQTDLQLNGLEEVPLLLVLRVVEELLDILAHAGYQTARLASGCCRCKNQNSSLLTDCNFRHG